jgi:tripartite ATP-independent transporter DctM subunit
VARLFAGGIIPGIILSIFFIITVTILVIHNPQLAPRTGVKFTAKEKFTVFWDLLPFVIIIALVLGTIFTGIMTPTESAALGAFLAIVLALIYRQMSFGALKESMLTAVNITAMIAFVLFAARMLGQVFQYIGLTDTVAQFMVSLNLGPYMIYLMVCILYIILGCFFDSFSMLVLTLPFVTPIMKNAGFDMIWFGIAYVVLAEIGLVTPPFGLGLFVLKGVVPKYEITYIFAGTIPFLIPVGILLVMLVIWPELVLWLPDLLYSR